MGVGIHVENLNAWYGKTQALYDIQLTVAANHATALIGPSGCGKSTFIRCLNRMHETIPEARVTGSVRIGEINAYNGTSATQLRRRRLCSHPCGTEFHLQALDARGLAHRRGKSRRARSRGARHRRPLTGGAGVSRRRLG